MANTLILNQSQVFNGLGTLTFTVPTTGQYNVQVQSTFPQAFIEGYAAGSNQGLGSGTGGGGEGFTGGDLGTGHGGVGQGFGAANGYQQPSAQGSNQTTNPAIASAISIVVNKNASPIYTSTAPTFAQSALQFKYGFQATAADTITVVLTSANASDKNLNGPTTNVSIGQGL